MGKQSRPDPQNQSRAYQEGIQRGVGRATQAPCPTPSKEACDSLQRPVRCLMASCALTARSWNGCSSTAVANPDSPRDYPHKILKRLSKALPISPSACAVVASGGWPMRSVEQADLARCARGLAPVVLDLAVELSLEAAVIPLLEDVERPRRGSWLRRRRPRDRSRASCWVWGSELRVVRAACRAPRRRVWIHRARFSSRNRAHCRSGRVPSANDKSVGELRNARAAPGARGDRPRYGLGRAERTRPCWRTAAAACGVVGGR